MHKHTVGVVIINWNRLELTKKCLASLKRQTFNNFVTIVVDNGSTDGSIEWLSSQNIKLIKNLHNRGFANAINQGISYALGIGCEYVVSLNNDALPDKDWLEKLVGFMESHHKISFAQGATMQEGNGELFDSTGIYLERGFIPNQRALNSKDPCLNLAAIGPNAAGAIYRSEMLKNVQIRPGEYFDGRFFAYVEDVDFNLRCTLRGHKFAYIPQAKLLHEGSATGSSIARRKMFWGARNMIWLIYKNASWGVFRRNARIILISHMANLQYLWREQRGNFLPYFSGVVIGVLLCPIFFPRRLANLKAQKLSDEQFLELLVPSNPPVHKPFRRLANLLK